MATETNRHDRAQSILVWDLPTRLFHWLLVASVSFALATGLFAPKWWVGRHIWAGYIVGALLIFRTIWAFHGSEFSRLRSFLYPPRQAMQHLRGMLDRRQTHHLGHNPAGAMMIFALIAILALIVATGFFVQGGFVKQGAFAGFVSYAVGDGMRGIHQLLAYLLLAMIAAHVAGVLVGSWLFKERLIGAMIDGEKPAPATADGASPSPSRPLPAILWLTAIGGLFAIALSLLWRVPPLGVPAMPANQAMLEECGACHHTFHPSLLPRASWAKMMANLTDHFGEDASLTAAKRDEIAAYLELYAAEAWDTSAAHRFSVISADQPMRITATPAWQRIHRRLDAAVFKRPAIKTKINCIACHRDADSGRFDPQAIALPP